jgi:hypothetical protein
MQYMVSQGVKPKLVSARGFGQADPIASNATAQGRAENRRIEITLAGGYLKRALRKQPSRSESPGGWRRLTLAGALYLTLPVSASSSALCPGKYHDTAVGT